MNREQKHIVIESLKAEFARSNAAFVVGIQGLTVNQLEQLRKGLRKEGGRLQVAKNTFTRRATDPVAELKDLQPQLKQQLAVVFAYQDSSAVAKVLCDYEKEHAKFSIVAGCLESRAIDQQMVKFLGSLPPRNVLAAQLCGTIQAPLVAPIMLFRQLMVRLVFVLQQASEKGDR